MISVVMSYFNRRPQLISTLKTIQESSVREKEVIIVDDGSPNEQSVDHLPSFDFPIKIKKFPRHALGQCPSRLYNVGFSMSSGDVIVIQNPENLHYGDVLEFASKNTPVGTYLLFSCRAMPVGYASRLVAQDRLTKNAISKCLSDGSNANDFYVNLVKRRPELHWCSAIRRQDLKDLNGFDERFAKGCDFDDDEFYRRVLRKRMNVIMLGDREGETPLVLHQDHPISYTGRSYRPLHAINKQLFVRTASELSFKANADQVVLQ